MSEQTVTEWADSILSGKAFLRKAVDEQTGEVFEVDPALPEPGAEYVPRLGAIFKAWRAHRLAGAAIPEGLPESAVSTRGERPGDFARRMAVILPTVDDEAKKALAAVGADRWPGFVRAVMQVADAGTMRKALMAGKLEATAPTMSPAEGLALDPAAWADRVMKAKGLTGTEALEIMELRNRKDGKRWAEARAKHLSGQCSCASDNKYDGSPTPCYCWPYREEETPDKYGDRCADEAIDALLWADEDSARIQAMRAKGGVAKYGAWVKLCVLAGIAEGETEATGGTGGAGDPASAVGGTSIDLLGTAQ